MKTPERHRLSRNTSGPRLCDVSTPRSPLEQTDALPAGVPLVTVGQPVVFGPAAVSIQHPAANPSSSQINQTGFRYVMGGQQPIDVIALQ